MRRNNKKLVAFMVIFVLVAVIFCVKITKNSSEQTLTITDCYGTTYLAVIDQSQNVYAAVTDKDGKLYGARLDENGEVVLGGDVYPIEDYTGTLPHNNTTVVNIEQTNNTNIDYAGEVSRVDSSKADVTSTSKKDDSSSSTTTKSDSSQENKTYYTDKYRELFKSGTYVMVFTTDDPDIPNEVTTAFKNGDMYIDTQVEGIDCQVVYSSKSKSGWIVIPTLRTYCELPEDMATDMAGANLVSDGDYDYVGVETYDVIINSKECTCEDFKYENGSRKSYFFDENGNLVRMDIIGKDGTADIYSISKISSTVPDDYFEKPKGYIKVDLSWLTSEDLEDIE